MDHVLKYYQTASYSCHYLIGYLGDILQIASDNERVPHVGVSKMERDLYLTSKWDQMGLEGFGFAKDHLSAKGTKLWKHQWADIAQSPQHLYPSMFPNDDYVGVEVIPLTKPQGKLWYTEDQHTAVAILAKDLAKRHGFELEEPPCPRLLGHEDLDAFGRWDEGGGWDPGALREAPRFSWALVTEALKRLDTPA